MGNRDGPPPAPEDAVLVRIAGLTDVGRVRDHNEDAFLIAGLGEMAVDLSEEGYEGSLPPAGLLFAVADGMGGAASGEVASRMAVETLRDQLRDGYAPDADQETLRVGLEGALTTANEKIFAAANQESKHHGMGTTMTAVLASDDRLCFSQVGDSRAYLVRNGEIVQLTQDQSLIDQLIRDGTLTEEEAERIGGRNIILQALGVEEAVQADTRHLELVDGDAIVVCSDGLSGMIPDEAILETVQSLDDPAGACAKLVEQANEGGGRDNISVIVARFTGGKLRSPGDAGDDPVVRSASPSRSSGIGGRRPLFLLAALFGGLVAVLLFLYFLFFSASRTPLVLEFEQTGVAGLIRPVGGGDPAREFELKDDERTLVVDDIDVGDWELVARKTGYSERTFRISVREGGSTIRELALQPVAARLRVRTNVPGTKVRVAGPDGVEVVETFDGSGPVSIYLAPGEYQVILRHRGYRERRETVTLRGEEEVPLDLPLEEFRGTLVVIGAVAGTILVAVEEDGDERRMELPPDGRVRLREGVYEITLQAGRHADDRRGNVRIEGEQSLRLEANQRLLDGRLVVKVGPETRRRGADSVEVYRGGEFVKGTALPEDAGEIATVRFSLPEGDYRIEVGDADRTVSVRADETEEETFP